MLEDFPLPFFLSVYYTIRNFFGEERLNNWQQSVNTLNCKCYNTLIFLIEIFLRPFDSGRVKWPLIQRHFNRNIYWQSLKRTIVVRNIIRRAIGTLYTTGLTNTSLLQCTQELLD